MEITRTSIISGVTRTRDLDVTLNQLQEWANGGLIQNVFSNLTPSEREFIKTGVSDEEWDALFSDKEQ